MIYRLLLSLAITAAIALTISLTACADSSAREMALQAQKTEPLMNGFATLSDSSDPADMAASVVYTRLALYRKRAAALLNNGLLPIGQAKSVQAIADTLRNHLDRARAGKNLAEIQSIAELLDEQIKRLERL
jgi:hypothetical protein